MRKSRHRRRNFTGKESQISIWRELVAFKGLCSLLNIDKIPFQKEVFDSFFKGSRVSLVVFPAGRRMDSAAINLPSVSPTFATSDCITGLLPSLLKLRSRGIESLTSAGEDVIMGENEATFDRNVEILTNDIDGDFNDGFDGVERLPQRFLMISMTTLMMIPMTISMIFMTTAITTSMIIPMTNSMMSPMTISMIISMTTSVLLLFTASILILLLACLSDGFGILFRWGKLRVLYSIAAFFFLRNVKDRVRRECAKRGIVHDYITCRVTQCYDAGKLFFIIKE